MKLIIFSDVHGNRYAFDAFIEDLPSYGRECEIIFLGDFFGYYYGTNEIIDYCRRNELSCVLGNHDQYFLDALDGRISIEELVNKYGKSYELALESVTNENIEFLRQLDKSKIITSVNKKVYLCHGSPLDNLEGRIYPDTALSVFDNVVSEFDYVVTGHTHHKIDRTYKNTVFLNPGSLGQPRDGRGCSYLILDLKKDVYDFYVVNYEIEKLENEIDRLDNGWSKLKSVLRRKP